MAWLVCLILAVMTWAVFGQTLRHDFVDYDDRDYVLENDVVKRGLTAEGFRYAFARVHAGNWHPLTTLSHMADVEWHGLKPGGHHLTNVVLHGGAVLLLFVALRRMTGSIWRSALVAAIFAIHPLRAESVAWIAERKDVLSGFFFVATLVAYSWYASRVQSHWRYLTVIILAVAGMMSKPMLVTLPFVLLLLDVWPLRRFPTGASGHWTALWPLVREKIPLFLLSAGSSAVTVFAQETAVVPLQDLPTGMRMANAVVSYCVYLIKLVWPMGLAPFYPHQHETIPVWQIAGGLLWLGGVTTAVVWQWRRRPYLLVGWFWYLGMLFPVIGIMQVGMQARADRYTYLPVIGVVFALVWLLRELIGERRVLKIVRRPGCACRCRAPGAGRLTPGFVLEKL